MPLLYSDNTWTKSDSTFSELNHGFESLGVGQSHHPEELGPATALM